MGELILTPVIMCGGAGTRLWPVSRETMPKQFVSLVGDQSTFQEVVRRVIDKTIFGRPVVVTNSDFRFIVAEQLREIQVEADVMLEPMRRDSALAVAVAATFVAERDPAAIVLILAADHVLQKNQQPLQRHVAKRQLLRLKAESSRLVSIPHHRPQITATYGWAQNSTAARRSQSRRSWKSPMPKVPSATWPITIFGTAVTSRSAPM
jgi:mannose-1-phosphate guanylyltransferase